MQMVTVIARETFPYDGINRRAGESFQASSDDARILALVGRVEVARAAAYAEAVDPAEDDAGVESRPVRRRSQRKDIVPEP